MKNKIILTFALTAGSMAFAQVGVNTPTPKSTFDITAINPTGIARNADGLLIPRVDRARAQLMQNVETSTMIYVNNLNGNAIGTTKNIDAVGFYYFDGIYWVKMVVDPSAFKDNDNNIYNTDGTLAANRTVTQNDKKLNFITTSENGFSVTSATAPVLTVSGNTNRVGIGYATPIGTLAVSNSSAQADNVIVAGYNKDTGDARNVVLYNSRTTNANFGGIEFVPGDKGDGLSGASIRGIDRDFSNGYGGLQFHTRNSKDFAPRMTIKSSGNIGIGTDAPTNLLHVNSATSGAVKIVDGTQANNRVLTSDANGVATWKDIPTQSFTDTSIYAGNGTIAGTNTTRTVAQATNNLAFTSTATTGTSHFTVDGTTLNVDAVNNRVGVGTAAPTNPLDVRSATAGAVKIVDGTQANNRVLTSDANGVATWKDIPAQSFTDTSIYAGNGTLSSNRTVAQAGNTLAFTSTATTGTNHFSVDGSTLSVDAVTNRVGIGTTTPQNLLDLGPGNGKKLALWNSATGDDFYGLGNAANVLQLFAGATAAGDPLMTLNKNGRVGIGTTAPATNFHTIGTRRFENATAGSVAVGSVLTATDTNGTAEWKTPTVETVVGGIDASNSIDIPFATNGDYKYTGRYITLPPGKWAVTITQLAQTYGALDNDDWLFVRSTFGEGSPALGATVARSGDVNGGPSLMSFRVQGPASAGAPQQFDVAQGTIFINNTSNGNKTYRYIVGNTVAGGNPNASTVIKAFGSTWSESSIFATAIK